MLNRLLLPVAAMLLFAALALSPQPAAAHWAGAPAAVTHATQADLSDVINVHSRLRRHYYWWGGPFAAAPYYSPPYQYYYFGPHRRRCGWVWSPPLYRHIWRCW